MSASTIKNLLIVESPAKAKTIEKYLGKDFRVEASYGHIRDLPKGDDAIDVANNFRPTYEISPDKQDRVRTLKKLAKQAEKVWLATDEDREGEAISWHLTQALGLDPHTTPRIVFSEITKAAIQQAIEKPRTLDMDLVNAQQARRILDRLVGFKLSPILWKKVKGGLSAGRVQSVAVRILVEREREILAFTPEPFFRVTAEFYSPERKLFKAELVRRLSTQAEAEAFLNACIGAGFVVKDRETKPAKRKPAPPFTTSTLQQEASRKLSFPVGFTMRVAQQLYEAGHITYMRTDSVSLSNQALGAITETVKTEFGEQYHQFRTYKSKSAGAQEAHEAIRPTNFGARRVSNDDAQQRLYDLIWKRTVASQMADAELERTLVHIDVLPQSNTGALPEFKATGEVILFDGFLKLYLEGHDDDDEDDDQGLLPPLSVGDSLTPKEILATERFTQAPARYTEATLVKKLEELGIGRPSTYAPTISTIQNRNYVEKPDRPGTERSYAVLSLNGVHITHVTKTETTGKFRNKLVPTDLGILVTDFLVQYFKEVMDYDFTAKVEGDFDEIARGKVEWPQMLDGFYTPFLEVVQETEQTAGRASGERKLGTDPTSGKPVIVRLGRYGPLVQLGDAEDEEKRFASLRADQRLETIELADALKLFDLPRTVGTYEGKEIQANIGRFGPYVRHDGKFISITKASGLDPYRISETEAIELIEAKREADRKKLIKEFPGTDYRLLNGRWGPFLAAGKTNIKLPKEFKDKPEALTLAQVESLVAEHHKAEAESGKKKAPAKKKTTAQKKPAAKKTTAKTKPASAKPSAKKKSPKS